MRSLRAKEGEETGPAPESSESRHSRVQRGMEEPLKEAKSEWAESQRGDHTRGVPRGKGRWSLLGSISSVPNALVQPRVRREKGLVGETGWGSRWMGGP